MATADSAQSSAMAATSSKPSRPSPPPPSKRDKKRQALNDRLALLADKFSRDKDKHYRDELQKIQIDVNLVSRIDPYVDRPLDAIDREYRDIEQSANTLQTTNASDNDSPKRSLLEMAGPTFSEYVHELEDSVEHRDYEMTCQKTEFERSIRQFNKTRAYKIEVAKREHRTLRTTLRDRLINAIMSKKHRLSKEKEALDISDSSALLLHPNQFSLTNPASPGGTHGKRNTRLRREMEDLPGFSENKKRKRNAVDDEGSPAPKRGTLDASNSTPFWTSDRGRDLRKETGPIYSIEKLFTDKELAMTHNAAALAAHKHFMIRRDTNGNIITPDESVMENGDMDDDDEEPAAPPMERQHSHTTRSTRGGHAQQNIHDDVLGIEALANFEIPGNLDKVAASEPKLPPLIQSQYSKAYRRDDSNTPPTLDEANREKDLAIMKMLKTYQLKHGVGSNLDVNNGGRRLLENFAAPPLHKSKYVAYVQGPRPSTELLSESLGIQESDLRGEVVPAEADNSGSAGTAKDSPAVAKDSPAGGNSLSGVPMSRQSSLGGTAMSRSGSARGKRKA
ncbi:hypothetical protein M426DRAFT_74015 [Hypoxylon sp. CI-4A]|nr:hypothetical protein M426DRAFT_74015 [Hypoxylon sp. CI-4A]